ncbi:hypothetical protein LZ554_009442 [Drepanopeziza brunnea f. sp. 'monogermtubi']|nr:hypothetical protein LZ554_009442 [Drepanopeziza brunnea f. sp. 'monogermtubi']
MVNTGKPSKGCYMCRARRIKCDEAKPHCMRCQKSKRICPGYRDAFELKLRDESKLTKKKMARRTSQDKSTLSSLVQINKDAASGLFADTSHSFTPTSSQGSHSRNTSTSSFASFTSQGSIDSWASDFAISHHQSCNIITRYMSTPLDERASCFFLANFIMIPENGTMRGHLDFVIPLLKQRNPPQCIVQAFSAVTLAAMGTRPDSKTLLPAAELGYLKALKEINGALQDPNNASSDSTLASIMLMALFEQIIPSQVSEALIKANPACPSRIKAGGWSSHVDGAVAVLKSRAIEHWQSSLGKEMFIAVRANMTIHCIVNEKHVSPGVDWMGITADDPIVESYSAANLKMAKLRADNDTITTARVRTAENIERALELLRQAQALDKEYIEWMNNLPPAWQIKTVGWVEGEASDLMDSAVHPGRVDTFESLSIAYHYNVVRGCRLFVWTTILRCVAWLGDHGDYRLSPEYKAASQICHQIIEEIVASIPYFFGWNRGKDPAMSDSANFGCGPSDPTSTKTLAGVLGMWPIFVAASSDFASPSQRVFLLGRLKHIAESMGVNQALIMFQAKFLHPSIYIARERIPPPPLTCDTANTPVTISTAATATAVPTPSIPEVPVSPLIIPQDPSWLESPISEHLWSSSPESTHSTSNWIPRKFSELPYLQPDAWFQEISTTQELPFGHVISMEYEKSHQPHQHAWFGAVTSA